MKQLFTYILLLLAFISCSEDNGLQYTISGNIGNADEKLYLFGTDSRYEKLDSAKSNRDGFFKFTVKADTVMPLALITPDGRLITLYAEPGIDATLQKDSTMQCGYTVIGGKLQSLHDSISRRLDACGSNSERMAEIDRFIEKYPVSEVNTEIMRRYMVETPSPDNNHIRNRISKLGGILQDNDFFLVTKKRIDKRNSNTLHRIFPHFSYTTHEGKKIELSTYNGKYTLITFWAAWDTVGRNEIKKLETISNTVKSKNFAVLNISLDHDTLQWKQFVEADSIVGDNACEPRSWNCELVNNFNISSLPYSILLSPYQRIVLFGADLNEMGQYIDSLATKHDKELERKEKEKKKKKNKSKKQR